MNGDTERSGRPDAATRVGRYRILERIGQGATAAVYRAHDEESGWPVALKLLLTDLEGEDQIRTRFLREVEIARVLRHRNLVTVYDAGEVDGRFYLAMELLDGVTLRDHLARHPSLPLEDKIDLMVQLCEGLAVAHDHGIYHRDLKPSNLFVREDGGLKILDFGIARLASSSMTVAGLLMGTPDFMSPEQARGADIDHRSDIFSAGAVFYYLLSGRKPFPGAQLPNVLHKVEHEDPVALGETEAPPALARIVGRALAKAPAARYQAVRALLRDLVACRREYAGATRALAVRARERAAQARVLADRARALAGELEAPLEPGAIDDEFAATGLASRHPRVADQSAAMLAWAPVGRALAADMADSCSALGDERRRLVEHLVSAAEALRVAREAAAAGDGPLAIEHAERALSHCPGSAAARRLADDARRDAFDRGAETRRARAAETLGHARRAIARGDWRAAEGHLTRAIELDPDSPAVAAVRDELLTREAEAGALRLERERQHKADIDALIAAAEEAFARSDFAEAARAASAVLAREPGESRAERLRAQAESAGQAESERASRAARVRTHVDQGRALAAAGRYPEARTEASRALAIDPKSSDARRLAMEIVQVETSRRRTQQAPRIAVRSARASRAFLTHASRALLLGDYIQARGAAETALAIDATSGEARELLDRARQAIDELGDDEPVPPGTDPEATQVLVVPQAWDRLRARLAGVGARAPAATGSGAGDRTRLRVERAAFEPRHVDLSARRYRVGRALNNEIVLDDPSHTVSRLHAELQPADGGYVLIDSQSDNGIWVDGLRVERVHLEPEVPVVIGPYQIVLEAGAGDQLPAPRGAAR